MDIIIFCLKSYLADGFGKTCGFLTKDTLIAFAHESLNLSQSPHHDVHQLNFILAVNHSVPSSLFCLLLLLSAFHCEI